MKFSLLIRLSCIPFSGYLDDAWQHVAWYWTWPTLGYEWHVYLSNLSVNAWASMEQWKIHREKTTNNYTRILEEVDPMKKSYLAVPN